MPSENYATAAKRYAEAVVAGDILTCNWVQRACKRQLNDLAKFKGKESGKEEKAEKKMPAAMYKKGEKMEEAKMKKAGKPVMKGKY
jgi:hypothetical protein